jgi:hypothetical protein
MQADYRVPDSSNKANTEALLTAALQDYARFLTITVISSLILPDPDIPPSAENMPYSRYGISSKLFYSFEEGQTHCQIWLYDKDEDRVLLTDEMVYTNDETCALVMPNLINYILDTIPFTYTEAPPPEEAPPEEVSGPEKPWSLGLAYKPMVPLSGFLTNVSNQTEWFGLGLGLTGSWVPWEFSWGKLGIHANFDWINGNMKLTGNKNLLGNFWSFHSGLVYQVPLATDQMQLEFRLGTGLDWVQGFGFYYPQEDYTTVKANVFAIPLDLNLNYRTFVLDDLYVDFGAKMAWVFDFDGTIWSYSQLNAGVGFRF